jgi:hypothetical protein
MVLVFTLVASPSINADEAMRNRSGVQMAPGARSIQIDPLVSRSNAQPVAEPSGRGTSMGATAGNTTWSTMTLPGTGRRSIMAVSDGCVFMSILSNPHVCLKDHSTSSADR